MLTRNPWPMQKIRAQTLKLMNMFTVPTAAMITSTCMNTSMFMVHIATMAITTIITKEELLPLPLLRLGEMILAHVGAK